MSDNFWQNDALVEPEPQEEGAMMGAMRGIGNDLDAGMQGVNPVEVAKIARSQSPVGTVVKMADGQPGVVFGDDVKENAMPISKVPGNRFVIFMHEDGNTYVYPRTEDMNENRLASAGRVLGYSLPSGRSPVVKSNPLSSIDQAGRAVGVSPSLAMRGAAGARIASAGEAFFPTAGRIIADNNRAAQEMATAATRTAESVAPVTGVRDAGEAMIDAANYFKKRSGDLGGRLFERVSKFIPKGTKADTRNTEAVLNDIVSEFAGKEAIGGLMGAKKYQGVLGDVSDGLSWGQMSKLRTQLMDVARGDTSPLASLQQGDRKRLIQALTADMEATAKAAGGDALTAWQNATNFWRKRADAIDGALAKLFKADNGEKAFADVFAMTSSTSSRANVRDLMEIKKKLDPETWGQVVSSVIDRMGKATPGAQNATGDVFSANTFMSNWNKISDEAKLVLFQGKGVPDGLRVELDALAEVVEAAKDGNVQLNKSRSAATGANLLAGSAAIGSMGDPVSLTKLGLGALMANLSVRALTNKRIIRGLTAFGKTGDASYLIRIAGGNTPEAVELSNALRVSAQQPELGQ